VKIQLLAFATAVDAVGESSQELQVSEGSRVRDLRDLLTARYPSLVPLWPRLAVAVDGELVSADTLLSEGSEVALLPPVSGGSPSDPFVRLVDHAIDADQLVASVRRSDFGAVLVFHGTVRDHHEGRPVTHLTYSAYRSMAAARLRTIAQELGADGSVAVGIVHRLGLVPAGEPSVVIAVASAHREKAYEASRRALERLKAEVPIWKREHFTDGAASWREVEPLIPPAPNPSVP